MVADDDLLATVVASTLARMEAQKVAAAHLARRRLAIWRLNNERGRPASRIAEATRDALLASGVHADDLYDAGVGIYSIEKIIRLPRAEL